MPMSADVPAPTQPKDLLGKASKIISDLNRIRAQRMEFRAGNKRYRLALAEGRDVAPPMLGEVGRGLSDRNVRKEKRRAIKEQRRAIKTQSKPKKLERLRSRMAYQDHVDERNDKVVLWVVLLNED